MAKMKYYIGYYHVKIKPVYYCFYRWDIRTSYYYYVVVNSPEQ